MTHPPKDEAELAFSPLHDLARWLREGKLEAEALTGIYLRRIEKYDGKLNAFLYVNRDGALQRARELDEQARSGRHLAPLHGVPVALKDDLFTADMPTTYGSRVLRGRPAPYDATLVKRLRDAGAIFLGKTNLDEWTLGVSSRNDAFGQTRNPYDLSRIPGGSSGGSAAAVACGLAAAAVGSDSSGSVRLPAAACGVFGIRATRGQISCYGNTPLHTTKGALGSLGRTSDDAFWLLQQMSGSDPHDEVSAVSRPLPPGLPHAALRGLRIAHLEELTIMASKPVRDSVYACTGRLAAAGAKVKSVTMLDEAAMFDEAALISGVEYATWVPMRVADTLPGSDYGKVRGGFDRYVNALLAKYESIRADAYCRALEESRPRYVAYYEELLRDHDVLLLPVTGTEPFEAARGTPEAGTLTELGVIFRAYLRPCELAGMIGFPAVSVPTGVTSTGLPAAIQLIGRPFDDARLLAIAGAIASLGPPTPRPPQFR